MATKRMIEKFSQMTKNEKRVAIARDVIAQLDAGIYRAQSDYFVPIDDFEGIVKHDNVRGKACCVCAKGAILLSRIGKFNHTPDYSVFELPDLAYDLSDNLKEFPDADEIEDAFEQNLGSCADIMGHQDKLEDKYSENPITQEKYDVACDSFVGQIDNFNDLPAEDRMRIIMQSIIDNKGKFKPLTLLNYEVV